MTIEKRNPHRFEIQAYINGRWEMADERNISAYETADEAVELMRECETNLGWRGLRVYDTELGVVVCEGIPRDDD